jgi:hypothetical protein
MACCFPSGHHPTGHQPSPNHQPPSSPVPIPSIVHQHAPSTRLPTQCSCLHSPAHAHASASRSPTGEPSSQRPIFRSFVPHGHDSRMQQEPYFTPACNTSQVPILHSSPHYFTPQPTPTCSPGSGPAIHAGRHSPCARYARHAMPHTTCAPRTAPHQMSKGKHHGVTHHHHASSVPTHEQGQASR